MDYETPQDFVEDWINVFTRDYSYCNELYAQGVLHVILGRCLINQRIVKRGSTSRPRVSLFYLQGPSSGKSSAYGMIYDVLDSLGIEIISPDELTDAALIGTIESETDAQGNTEYQVQEGVLADAEVMHYDEASVIIEPKSYQENTMTYLQKALNPIGSESNKITKELAHGDEIIVRPTCSLLLTSYMPDGLEDTVLNTGFLQRMITIPRDLTIEDRMAQTRKDIEALGEGRNDGDLEDLIMELKRIRNTYNEPVDFHWSDAAKKVLMKYQEDMFDQIKDTPIEVRRILEGFVPRMMEQLYRLSLHYCCMRRSTTIIPDDVNAGRPLIMTSLHMIIHWLEENPDIRDSDDAKADAGRRFRGLKEVIEHHDPIKGGYYGVSQIMSDLKKAWGLSETSCYRWIDIFEDKDWIDVRDHGTSKYVRVKR